MASNDVHSEEQKYSPLDLAKFMHNEYERLAPNFGYETREDTKTFDVDSPNGKLMCAVMSELIVYLDDYIEPMIADAAKRLEYKIKHTILGEEHWYIGTNGIGDSMKWLCRCGYKSYQSKEVIDGHVKWKLSDRIQSLNESKE